MLLESLLTTFCREFRYASTPQKNQQGMYPLPVSAGVEVAISALTPGFYFLAPIAPLPEAKTHEALFIYLMRANFLGASTGRTIIGLDPNEKAITLAFAYPKEPNYQAFCESLETFVNYLTFWRQEIPRYQQTLL